MKHLVKKYVKAVKVGDDVVEVLNNASVDEKAITEISNKKMDGYFAMALTDTNHIVQTFKYVNGQQVFLIPEPDPIIIYFDTARHFHKDIAKKKLIYS